MLNTHLEKLCISEDMTSELSAFETSSIVLRNKAIKIIEVINQKEINIDSLRKLSFTGVPPEVRGLRPMVWKLLLGCLPTDPTTWDDFIRTNFQTYEDFKRELIVKPQLKAQDEQRKQVIDHPLSRSQNSVWNTFFKD